MRVKASILVGVASSAAFFLIQKYLLGWPYPWDVIATVAVLATATAIAFFLTRRASEEPPRGAEILTGIETEGDVDAKIDGLEMSEPPAKIMSGIKTGGDGKFEIRNTKL